METNRGDQQGNIGESEEYLSFLQKLSRVAKIDRPVLIIGERGSGKELAVKRLHYLSSRWQENLVTVNCAALPSSLIETELFGYEQGAFTGATKTRKGRFEEAEGGTLFLDEIGLIPLEVQEKLLRVVEYGTYERVGSSVTHETNVRIIGATNADLEQLCREGKFKDDLLDRLSFEVIFIPPLRKRGEDILLLANYFASRMALECGRENLPVFSPEVEDKLLSYSWPGNVRELKNVVERAVYRAEGDTIENIEFNPFFNPYKDKTEQVQTPAASASETPSVPAAEEKKEHPWKNLESLPLAFYAEAQEQLDVVYLSRALTEAGGNQRAAASSLGLTYDQFRGLYRKYKDRIH
jgi:psp operon transcriptional activator PspF